MKPYFFICLLVFAACKNNTTSNKDNAGNKTATSLVNNPLTANGVDTVAAALKPIMAFNDTLHDFGAIHENEIVKYDFAFTNTGKTPLIITQAAGTCGCTVPEYPKEAVQPGKNGIIKVTFNSAGKTGHQDKAVIIHTNTLKGIEMLYIKADIAK